MKQEKRLVVELETLIHTRFAKQDLITNDVFVKNTLFDTP